MRQLGTRFARKSADCQPLSIALQGVDILLRQTLHPDSKRNLGIVGSRRAEAGGLLRKRRLAHRRKPRGITGYKANSVHCPAMAAALGRIMARLFGAERNLQ